MSTGGFSSFGLLKEEEALVLPSLSNNDAIEIGLIAVSIGRERSLPVSFEVRIGLDNLSCGFRGCKDRA